MEMWQSIRMEDVLHVECAVLTEHLPNAFIAILHTSVVVLMFIIAKLTSWPAHCIETVTVFLVFR
jgi:hypothetical protein